MKKKLLSVVLATAMALSVCACGNEPQASVSTEETKVATSEVVSSEVVSSEVVEEALYPIVDEPITIKGLVVDGNVETRKDRLVWNKVSEITGINIEWVSIDKEALSTYLAGNDWPDFFHCPMSTSIINDYGVIGGRFANLYDYMDVMPNYVAALEAYPMAEGAVKEINGEMYRFPYIEKASTGVGTRTHVRTDVLDAAGVKMPATVEEFKQALIDLKAYYGEVSYIPNLFSYWGPMLFGAFGTETNMRFDADANEKVYTNMTSEQTKLYWTFMNELYEEGLVHQEFLTLDGTARNELAKSGKMAFLNGEANKLAKEDFADGKFHIDVCAPLTSEYDKTQTLIGNTDINISYSPIINKNSKYVEEMCKMFDIMYATEEVVEGSGLHGMSFCYGIEGVDWKYGAEGSGNYELIAPESYNGAFSTYQYAELVWKGTGLATALEGLVASTEGNSRERQLGYVKGVLPYQEDHLFPINYMKFNDDEQYVLDNKLADITTYYEKMAGQFVTGVVDIETGWDEYCKTLEDMGINDIIKVYQASYDRWIAD